MTRLFLRFYIGVLLVLLIAWAIHGEVLRRRSQADRARVVTSAHRGGARIVSRELREAPVDARDEKLKEIQARFVYPIRIVELSELPAAIQRQIRNGADVAYVPPIEGNAESVVAALDQTEHVVCLGPFPSYDLRAIEESISGWVALTANQIANTRREDQQAEIMRDVNDAFDFPVVLVPRSELPASTVKRFESGTDVVFYANRPNQWFAATPLENGEMGGGTTYVRFGPFPNFENIEQKAATTTVALVLLPAAVAIAFLLRPVARQLRQLEQAATSIAQGDLSARVDERRMHSAKPLAQAFNQMANRTESLVRTQRELLQAVSHELRTPLARMQFAIDLISSAHSDEERNEKLAVLDATAEELNTLVDELLRYVRMETSEPHLNIETFDVRGTLQDLVRKYETLFPDKRIELAGRESKVLIVADRLGFQRAIGNLVSNAVRHANTLVRIDWNIDEIKATILIDDDGCGIPSDDRERVFDPFARIHSDSDQEHHGVGLGLALVKRIIAQHGGEAAIHDSPLGGCRVLTTWPLNSSSKTHGVNVLETDRSL